MLNNKRKRSTSVLCGSSQQSSSPRTNRACLVMGLLLILTTTRDLQSPNRRQQQSTFVCRAFSFEQPALLLSSQLKRRRRRTKRDNTVPSPLFPSRGYSSSITWLYAAKKTSKSKNKKPTTSASVGIKGFGGISTGSMSSSSSPSATTSIQIDRSARARQFYDYLERNGAGANLQRTALANSFGGLRGVVATKDIAKGEDIISIPYELAVNLGRQGDDPTLPALQLLQDYCHVMSIHDDDDNNNNNRRAYYDMLPGFGSSNDYLTSTDFFSSEALDALQSPLIVEETLARRERVQRCFDASFQQQPMSTNLKWWNSSSAVASDDITISHLQWAVWLITSRVLTVQGSSPTEQYRLLIPYLDMCNHDRSSPHILTGRAVPNGLLRVVAGRNVRAGEFINICYGGGVTGNDRFIQDYGFVDASPEAFQIVAQQLLGKFRVPAEGGASGGGKLLSPEDCTRALESLRATTLEQDEAEWSSYNDETSSSNLDLRTALQYRIGVKKALAEVK